MRAIMARIENIIKNLWGNLLFLKEWLFYLISILSLRSFILNKIPLRIEIEHLRVRETPSHLLLLFNI
ncbi:unnamed protein product [Meloidogyne enterolobii]|uniref:Uncharacterized protein n=1 Tax=Meloidogyne enterolobii TaxID=390850 RepID=A0ACB0Z0C8_MELEN